MEISKEIIKIIDSNPKMGDDLFELTLEEFADKYYSNFSKTIQNKEDFINAVSKAKENALKGTFKDSLQEEKKNTDWLAAQITKISLIDKIIVPFSESVSGQLEEVNNGMPHIIKKLKIRYGDKVWNDLQKDISQKSNIEFIKKWEKILVPINKLDYTKERIPNLTELTENKEKSLSQSKTPSEFEEILKNEIEIQLENFENKTEDLKLITCEKIIMSICKEHNRGYVNSKTLKLIIGRDWKRKDTPCNPALSSYFDSELFGLSMHINYFLFLLHKKDKVCYFKLKEIYGKQMEEQLKMEEKIKYGVIIVIIIVLLIIFFSKS